jgi:hypothetical protein
MTAQHGFIRKWWMTTFFDVKFADNVSVEVRKVCSRYGDQVVGSMFAAPYIPPPDEDETPGSTDDDLYTLYLYGKTRIQMREWLAEQLSIREYRERWTPLRDLILEIAVIGLIGWEIHLGYQQERQQSNNFDTQQGILKNLNDSSKATADTLASLKQTTDLELAAMKESTGLSERSAKASEASASTSAKALHVSERAYLSTTIALSAPFKAGEKQNFTSTILNSGRTTAVEVKTKSRALGVPKGTTEEVARTFAFSDLSEVFTSKSIIAAGQQIEQIVEAQNALTEEQVSYIADGRLRVYAFVNVEYKDLFDHLHHTEICTFYEPISKRMLICAAFNKAD